MLGLNLTHFSIFDQKKGWVCERSWFARTAPKAMIKTKRLLLKSFGLDLSFIWVLVAYLDLCIILFGDDPIVVLLY